MTTATVEVEAIETARAYAVANGYAAEDAVAVGLVLVGMVLGAGLSDDAAGELVLGYLHAHRGAAEPMRRWLERIERSAS